MDVCKIATSNQSRNYQSHIKARNYNPLPTQIPEPRPQLYTDTDSIRIKWPDQENYFENYSVPSSDILFLYQVTLSISRG
ncbi:hypothetical protein O6P43_007306 [Quillaja saponaria]|uniref:Uncharacterized protein n=1 Tax=Quillaja saponaria TaxID=32244 RepID=A0AAD7VJE3_QUISA|nr:hypothetical protein O6P43_007306 [Quillaja saponaria]